MNKGDLAAKISQDCECTKSTAEKALGSVLEGIGDALKNGDSEKAEITSRKVVTFKPSRLIKQIVNN